ncbi:MAG: 16S rRNA (guanine(966)-N(2))-methyltransferase RsmD [Ardenticatenaceae bacterium]|nr:16S rRNA (guanine(966)-N(2))-methyltransferase RsmD [Ardenticatenaceae bacterium]MCB8946561.1 16S rRNA (guanine(966)-N(2))-methyltransferase RsmD [Ardenticatenaceae bacterium]
MRVISGSARGSRLKRVPGDSTRPIMDRVKESLFNILGKVDGEVWLDLFAGTGQVGIEALSRGAGEVVFIDKVRPAIKTIEANLKTTRLQDRAKIVQADAFDYLNRSAMGAGNGRFHLIYVAPPQYLGLWQKVMAVLDERPSAWLTTAGIVAVQIDPKEYEPLTLQNLTLYDSRTYGNTQLCFYEQLEEE